MPHAAPPVDDDGEQASHYPSWRLSRTAEGHEEADTASPLEYRYSLTGNVPLEQPLISTEGRPSRGHTGIDPKGRPWSAPKDLHMLWSMIQSSYFSMLLVFVPLGLAAGVLQWSPLAAFCLNLVALIPLALLLGDVTEALAEHYGDVVGGLLNATFGNVRHSPYIYRSTMYSCYQ